MWKNLIFPQMPVAAMSASDIKRQKLSNKKQTNTNEWKDRAKESLRYAERPYVHWRGELKQGKSALKSLKEVRSKTEYVHVSYLSIMLAVPVRGACTACLLQFIQFRLFSQASHEWVEMQAGKVRIKGMF